MANLEGLQTTIKKYSESERSKNYGLLSFVDLESIFMIDSKPRILQDKSILVASAILSKQSVVNDFAHKKDLATFNDAEFFEIIGRIVDIASRGTLLENYLLSDKMIGVLEQIVLRSRT